MSPFLELFKKACVPIQIQKTQDGYVGVLTVKAVPGARVSQMKVIDGAVLKVSFSDIPIEGRANAALVQILSEFFCTPSSQIKLLSGQRSRTKKFQLEWEFQRTEKTETLVKLQKHFQKLQIS